MEPILMFVFIAIISSIFRKDNKPAPRRKQTARPPRKQTGKVEKRVPTETRVPQKREVYNYDTLEEIESNYYHMKEEVKPKKPVKKATINKKQTKKDIQVIDVNRMKEEETKFDGELVSFTPNAMVQAVIMSEILDKPKSLR